MILRMNKTFFSIIAFFVLSEILVLSSCEPKEDTVSNKIKFQHYYSSFEVNGNAIRTRSHKTISLKIYSNEGNFNPVVNINVPKYTDSDHYKRIPDTTIFMYPDVNFIILDRNYYESFEGRLTILADNDKIITGFFEFGAINLSESDDTIYVEKGEFELEYLPSKVTK